jgi:hypothetical protein
MLSSTVGLGAKAVDTGQSLTMRGSRGRGTKYKDHAAHFPYAKFLHAVPFFQPSGGTEARAEQFPFSSSCEGGGRGIPRWTQGASTRHPPTSGQPSAPILGTAVYIQKRFPRRKPATYAEIFFLLGLPGHSRLTCFPSAFFGSSLEQDFSITESGGRCASASSTSAGA